MSYLRRNASLSDRLFVYGVKGLVIVPMVLIFASIVWKFVASAPIYELSDGTMQARSAKLSYKGLIWKTHEGWIPLGMDGEGMMKKWKFTVKDGNQTVIDCINNNKEVKLHYKDYIGMPFRLGSAHQVDKCEAN